MSGPALDVWLLGAPRAEVGGQPLAVDTRKATALLAYLAVEGGGHRRDSLAELLWPDYERERARAALRRTLSTLRTALGGDWLAVARETVSLERHGLRLDVDEFHRLAGGDDVEQLEGAAALHRGPFLAGFGLRDSVAFDDWQSFQAGSLARELADVLDRLAAAYGARGDHSAALDVAQRRLALDPMHESAHRRLIQLYGWSGDRAASLAQYRECVRILHRELGVAPTEETTALYRAIREGIAEPTPRPPAAAAAHGVARHALVGRERAWEALLAADAAVGPDGRLTVLEGELGIGKTRLADELTALARERGAVTATVSCVEEEAGLAFGCAIELLRNALRAGDGSAVDPAAAAEAARLLPELGSAPTASLDAPGAEARFLDALARVLLEATVGDRPAVAVVDDAHWADHASLEALAYLVRRLRGRPMHILLTWRPEELDAAHPARRILAQASREGLGSRIVLERLDLDGVARLAAAVGASEEDARRLYDETQGVPLFVVEYLDAGATGAPAMPPGVRGVLESRLAAASEIGVQVLAAASVIGRPFDLELVRDVSGRSDEETVAALEELVRRGIVAVNGEMHAFRHELWRRVAYEQASPGRRRLLHRRAADALAGRDRGGALAGVVAHHLELAGREADAAEWFRRAGDHARDLHANAEALAHYRAALALEHPDAAALNEAVGDLQTLSGDYAAALESYEAAAALAEPDRLAGVAHRIGLVHHRRGEWELAESSFVEALGSSPNGGAEARILADRSLTAHRRHADDEARAFAERALALALEADDRRALAQAHNILGILASGAGDHAEARRLLQESLALAEREGDPSARAAALNNLALVERAEGSLDRALELTEEALRLCATVGDRHREAALLGNCADLLHGAGRGDEAMDRLKSAVAIFAEVGGSRAMEPEIWKLVEW